MRRGLYTAWIVLVLLSPALRALAGGGGPELFDYGAVLENGNVVFRTERTVTLPGSLVSIHQCTDAYMNPDPKFDCAMRALDELEKERDQLRDPQIRAWKFYLSGVIYGQLTYLSLRQKDANFRSAKEMFLRATNEPGAQTFKGPSLHYLAYLNLATHDFRGVLDMLERLQAEVHKKVSDLDRFW